MTIEIRVPQLPESVSDATLVNWHRAAGDPVRRDEKLVELETDKVVLEVPSPGDGILSEVRVADGATVTSGEVLALLEPGAEADATHGPEAEVDDPVADAPEFGQASVSTDSSQPSPMSQPSPTPPPVENDEFERAGPAVRRLMREHRVDPGAIRGTGRGGRITKSDVLDHVGGSSRDAGNGAGPSPGATAKSQDTAGLPERSDPPKPASPQGSPGATTAPAGRRTERRVPMSRLRARIAERLVQAQHSAAMLTTFNEVDMSSVMAARSRHGESFRRQHDVKLGFMSFFIKASIEALRRFPVLNASVDGGDIVHHEYFDIGVAVSTDKGLVVPILRNAERLSYAGIERAIVDFGDRARRGELGMEDLTGGTFTLTNGGIFGSMMSTPIINPPQSGILGMHAIQQRPVVVDGGIEIRPMMYLALTYDHRIVDGREAVQFLVALKDLLEDPARLLLQV